MNLFDFEDADPPKIHCKKWIPHPVNEGMSVGTLGVEQNRDQKCALFLHRRRTGDDGKATWNRAYEGYAISDWILDLLERFEVPLIYIAVQDERRMFEFDRRQYEDGVPFEWRDDDPQHCVPLEHSKHEWAASETLVSDPEDTERLGYSREWSKAQQ